MKFHATSVALSLTLLSGCHRSPSDSVAQSYAREPGVANESRNSLRIDEIALNYSSLNLITTEPVLVDPQLAMQCVGTLEQRINDARKRSGPHVYTSIRIYMNDLAHAAFRGSANEYPVGSIIVKEKQGLKFREEGAVERYSKTHDGVGGMIKRAPGFDPEHGDWEYFYFEDASQVEQGKITSCIECHHAAAKSDYVFGHWAAALESNAGGDAAQ